MDVFIFGINAVSSSIKILSISIVTAIGNHQHPQLIIILLWAAAAVKTNCSLNSSLKACQTSHKHHPHHHNPQKKLESL